MGKQAQEGYFYIIPAPLVEEGENLTKAVLFGLITSLCNKYGYCNASNKFLAEKLKRKDISIISNYLTELENEGWVEIEGREGGALTSRKIRTTLGKKPQGTPGKNPQVPFGNFQGYPEEKSSPSSIDSKIVSNIKNIYKKKKKQITPEKIAELESELVGVLACWNGLGICKHVQVSEKAIGHYMALLGDFTKDEVLHGMRIYGEIIRRSSLPKTDPQKTYFSHKWTLEEFLGRGNGCRVFIFKKPEDYLSNRDYVAIGDKEKSKFANVTKVIAGA